MQWDSALRYSVRGRMHLVSALSTGTFTRGFMKTKYPGSCHCGAVRFEAEIDLSPPAERSPPERPGVWWTTTFRCNCSYCSKSRYWKAFVPAGDFRWLSGREASSVYQFAG